MIFCVISNHFLHKKVTVLEEEEDVLLVDTYLYYLTEKLNVKWFKKIAVIKDKFKMDYEKLHQVLPKVTLEWNVNDVSEWL